MILESNYLSHYILMEKSKNILPKNLNDLFKIYLKESTVIGFSAYFNSPQREMDLQAHKKLMEQLFDEFFYYRMLAYKNSEVSTIELFRIFIAQNAFNNNNNVNLKFMEMKIINKLRIKFAQFLLNLTGDSKSKMSDTAYLNIHLLDSVIMNIWNALMDIDAAIIYSQCK